MKTMTLSKDKNRFMQGLDFLSYGLKIFAFIGFELLLAYGLEFNIYGCNDWKDFTKMQTVIHWILTCAVWLFGAWYVVRECAKKSEVDLFKNFKEQSLIKGAKEMSVIQWVLLIVGTVLCLISTWIDWGGKQGRKRVCQQGYSFPNTVFLLLC